LTASDTYAALEFSVAGMRRRRDLLLTVWKATALVHTFLDQHQLALECYEHALGLADTPAMRAQLYMYLGLIAGKRLHRSQQAQDYLARGFQAIADVSDADAALERGWLLNVSALMAYQAGQHADAMRMVQEALTHLRPFHHSEATHLKINVVSNISVLLEDSGRLEQSLATWGIFRSFLGAATEIFAKHYQYREGGLRLKAGQPVDAQAAFLASHAQAAAIGDSFHMEVAARACGYASHALGEMEEAERWYAASVAVCEQIGNYPQLPKSLLAQALCAYEVGDPQHARVLVEQAETLAQRLEVPLPAARLAQLGLQTGAPGALADWATAVLESPGSKLNRPFSLTNLAPAPAA
jgi:tetratricopeptide (TPR) repeat protein